MATINHRLTRDALSITFARPAVALSQSGKIFNHRNILNSSSILKRVFKKTFLFYFVKINHSG